MRAEICRDHLFDPALAAARLPTGYRLLPAEEVARSDASLAGILRQQPEFRLHAVGSLCFMSIEAFDIDGAPVIGPEPMPVAFWWAATEGPRHPDMRGKASYVQLGSWYPRGATHAGRILRTDPMARFVAIEVRQVAPGNWKLSLALPDETVTASVRAGLQSAPSKGGQPGAMSVPMSGESAAYFTVYSYAGHRQRAAEGRWSATGAGIFAKAFAVPGEASAFATIFQDSWTAQSGLYRFAPR
ncbi:MAG: hypothetical protein IPL06_01965 [Betaproteobacteria bacterium]|nr:hypothetical protein [Betaproteobacteria bacterium]